MTVVTTLMWLGLFFINDYVVECTQPYFPPQVTFNINDDTTIMAIDEVNQQAYHWYISPSSIRQYSFVMEHFPHTIPDSPESKYYVQLRLSFPSNSCEYEMYWKYGSNMLNSFPAHWSYNSSSFIVGNYIKFNYDMIHSSNDTGIEDYWYANRQCQVSDGEVYPCEEIYFKKNTNIPLRTTRVVRQSWDLVQITTKYKVISIGKPDDGLFDTIPKNWAYHCTDVMLRPLFNPLMATLELNKSLTVQVWLIGPPHRINGNDTVTIEWQSATYSACTDCVTWTPKQVSFNSKNFQERQTLIITRVKDTGGVTLVPIFNGGGFDTVMASNYPIYIYKSTV